MLRRSFLLPDFRVANGDGRETAFDDLLADFNIVLIRRVPVASHGPATRFLRRLLNEYSSTPGVTARGFDIRSSDEPCETCGSPCVVSDEEDLVTVCDCDRRIYQHFEVAGDNRYFVIGADRRVLDVGSLQDMRRSSRLPRPGIVQRRQAIAQQQFGTQNDRARQPSFDGSSRLRHASK